MNYKEFKVKYNIQLNNQQETAVQRIDGQTLLLAVPGSGKTTVIVSRLGYMVNCLHINPRSILTMTFSKASTMDMKQRYARVFGCEQAKHLLFSTINAFCNSVISVYERSNNKTRFNLLSEEKTRGKIIRDLYISIYHDYPTENTIGEIGRYITYANNMMLNDKQIDDIDILNIDFLEMFNAYKKFKIANNLMDFDDQLKYAYSILRRYSDILEYFQNKYKYINVDEAQDTSKIQHCIINLLGKKHGNIFMVGDEDQSIYSFRGAYPQALLGFSKTYPQAKVLLMETNYRSTKEIVNKANMFIKMNKERHNKNMVANNENGCKITNVVLDEYIEQYEYLAQLAKKCTDDTAVLYRNNESAVPVIDYFSKHNIPYRCKENDCLFFSHYIVMDIVSILQFSMDTTNVDIFEKIYYKFGTGLTKDIFLKAKNSYNRGSGTSFLDTIIIVCNSINNSYVTDNVKRLKGNLHNIQKLSAKLAVRYIVKIMGYGCYLEKSKRFDESKINILTALACENKTIQKLIERLATLKEIVSQGSLGVDCSFSLSTIHASKGLEYDNVIIIDVKDGVLPDVDNIYSTAPEDIKQMEEERRLFYVGITRAKKSLTFISCKKQFDTPLAPSSFIRQLIYEDSAVTEQGFNKNMTVKEFKSKLKIGGYVVHKTYGDGKITNVDDKYVYISFYNKDIRSTFDIKTCAENKLLFIKTK
ncbi:MAG TPA: ATP-dependent helicase [Clostridiales bacterium]|nr:ATP-dependent helicase [Clostridiales bacterium]